MENLTGLVAVWWPVIATISPIIYGLAVAADAGTTAKRWIPIIGAVIIAVVSLLDLDFATLSVDGVFLRAAATFGIAELAYRALDGALTKSIGKPLNAFGRQGGK